MEKTLYHVGDNGLAAVCKATVRACPYGNSSHGRFESEAGAVAWAEGILAKSNEDSAPLAFKIVSPGGGKNLSSSEFRDAAADLSEAFPTDSWELLNSFYADFQGIISQEQFYGKTAHETVPSVLSYLESDSETAQNVRDFLGPEVDLEVFASILVKEVRSMTSSEIPRNSPRLAIRRSLCSGVANDMTKERYVASVLFFGGRCCYCNVVMTKTPGPTQATGEHITPVNPADSEIVGVTRYGNMALACFRCNSSRSNTNLDEWIEKTDLLQGEEKDKARRRIVAFRKFALYRDYSEKQSEAINDCAEFLTTMKNSMRRHKGSFVDEDFNRLNDTYKILTFDLRQVLSR